MSPSTCACVLLLAGISAVSLAAAPAPTHAEMSRARRWALESFRRPRAGAAPPFSFVYGGKRSSELLPAWTYHDEVEKLDACRTRRTVRCTDPVTGLQVRCALVQYADYPTVEWTLHLKNTGSADTPIIEGIQALDVRFARTGSGEFVLHHNVGSLTTPQDYRPIDTALLPGSAMRIGSVGGRPLNTDMPYFNLEWGGEGAILALGWPGQWTSAFARDSGAGLHVTAGQELTHFTLHPGEEVRGPLVVLQFWDGDVVRSQNLWRRWMRAHNLPRQNGELLGPVFSGAAADVFPNLVVPAKDEVVLLAGYNRNGLRMDYWWRDAGWYPCSGNWVNTGTWEPDPVNYPKGLRETADLAHAEGMKFTVWFEPERVTPGSWLAENHPEWVIGGKAGGLFDLGNPTARAWMTDHIDRLIADQHIDMYRQDFNMDPLEYWRSKDTPDRQGISEIRHVEGLLAFWDELKRRHPGMPFDCCASGGRRNELEMMRRGVPLSKSDYAGGTASSQCQLYGIAPWLPYYGAGVAASEDLYLLRSNIAPWSAACWDTRNPKLNYGLIRQYLAEWRRVSPYLAGDFYPLTPYSLDESVWMAWQFGLPEKGEGIVQAFRRPQSPDDTATYRLRALEPGALYELTDLDGAPARRMSGRELMRDGVQVTMKQKPWAAVVFYRRVPGPPSPRGVSKP